MLDLDQQGRFFKILREKRGMGFHQLAGAASISVDRLASIEAGQEQVTEEEVIALATAVGINPEIALLLLRMREPKQVSSETLRQIFA
jgi:transcriptional regulator with XRE-family HTH domain